MKERRGYREDNKAFKYLKEHKNDILSFEELEPDRYNKLVDMLKEYLKESSHKITTSQLRNIFSLVKKRKEPKGLLLLRPKLAYVASRQENNEAKKLVDFLDELVKDVDDKQKLKNFQSFFEAIIAYRKYFGGKRG